MTIRKISLLCILITQGIIRISGLCDLKKMFYLELFNFQIVISCSGQLVHITVIHLQLTPLLLVLILNRYEKKNGIMKHIINYIIFNP